MWDADILRSAMSLVYSCTMIFHRSAPIKYRAAAAFGCGTSKRVHTTGRRSHEQLVGGQDSACFFILDTMRRGSFENGTSLALAAGNGI